jgi:hypothetical protein
MALNWPEIFEKRPDLEPPGYRDAAEKVAKAWAEKPKKVTVSALSLTQMPR